MSSLCGIDDPYYLRHFDFGIQQGYAWSILSWWTKGRVVVLECFAHEWKCFMPQLPSLALASCDHSRPRTDALSSLSRLEHN